MSATILQVSADSIAFKEQQQMYLENKYTTWYYNIINHAKSRILSPDVYTEKHHIIPKCMGGSNNIDNLVKLTAREHFICHLLLTKMTEGNVCYKMKYALSMISYAKNIGNGRYILKNRMIEYTKKCHREAIANYWTEQKRKERSVLTSKLKSGIIFSDEHKEKLRRKTWTEKAINTRLNNCLKNAAARKGVPNPHHHEKVFNAYVRKNKFIFIKIWEMYDNGKNRRQISLERNISWDRVNLAINNKEKILTVIDKK